MKHPRTWYVITDGGRARIVQKRDAQDAFDTHREFVSADIHRHTHELKAHGFHSGCNNGGQFGLQCQRPGFVGRGVVEMIQNKKGGRLRPPPVKHRRIWCNG